MKYLLVGDDGVSTLKSGTSPFDWSLFTDSESEPSLKTQRTERGKHFLLQEVLQSQLKKLMLQMLIKLHYSCQFVLFTTISRLMHLCLVIIVLLERNSRLSAVKSEAAYKTHEIPFGR